MKRRKSVLAGAWYPGNKEDLLNKLEKYFQVVDADNNSSIKETSSKVIVPHAGYAYSGLCAAYGYRSLRKKDIKKAIILSPSHTCFLTKNALPSSDFFETPLGNVSIDKKTLEKLTESFYFEENDEAHSMEHAVEIQLPFIQYCFPDISIVPVVIGHIGEEGLKESAVKISEIIDESTLLIISSDFTHYGANFSYVPFTENIRENIYQLDGKAIDYIVSKDPKGFSDYVSQSEATICGQHPIRILLELLPEKEKGELLNFYTSGDVGGDFSHSVSYASIAFH
ncbi:MAG: AmmeMemoRadiSam system protein B [Nitrospinae bacterium]|nr:AmmeMemoRadiSam system protein B [Nitrospinota bacterium]